MPLKAQSVKLLEVSEFTALNMKSLKDRLLKKYGAGLFLPFYDRGTMRGYFLVTKKGLKGEDAEWNESTLKRVSLFNATHHNAKLWAMISKKKVKTVLIRL